MKSLLDARVVVTDPDLLGSVRKEDMRRVLSARGWSQSFSLIGGGEVWAKPEDDELTQVLVSEPKFADHARRVYDFVHTVTQVENISPLRLLLDLIPRLKIDADHAGISD